MAKVTYKPHRRRPGCLLTTIILLALIIGFFWIANKAGFDLTPESFKTPVAEYGEDEFPQFDEIWSYGQGSNKVVRISITGMILLGKTGSFLNPESSAGIALQSIKRATLDKDVLAIILDIDSGGGGITASDIIYKALLDFKKHRPNRRVVALYGDTAASGAYYISLAADHIIARPTSITGSIGVIVPSVNFHELATKYGIKDASTKSGANKDLLNPLTETSAEQQAIIQAVVDDLYNHFVKLVAKNRDIPEQEVRTIADGRIFTAPEALRLKLIDETGYWDDAMTRTAELLDVDNIIVYRYEGTISFRAFLRASQSIHPKTWFQQNQSPRIQYRW